MWVDARLVLRVALCVFPAGVMLTAVARSSENLYCCDDPSGRRICGNPLPLSCYNRAYKELSQGGRTKREVDAPLTAEERTRKEAAERVRRDLEARTIERRRRDRALLDSYPSVAAIEERRNASLSGAAKEIEVLHRRESVLVAERTQQDAKLASLKAHAVPRSLQEDIAATNSELSALRTVIVQKRREYELQKKRFDEDRSRYIELTSQSAPGTAR